MKNILSVIFWGFVITGLSSTPLTAQLKKERLDTNKTRPIPSPNGRETGSDITKEPSRPPVGGQKLAEPTLHYAYYAKGAIFEGDPPALFVRTDAYKLSLRSGAAAVPALAISLFFEAQFENSEFERAADGSFTLKRKPDRIYIHLINKSAPNLKFGARNDRLLWFDIDDSRWVVGTLCQTAIAEYGTSPICPVPMQSVENALAYGDKVTELLSESGATKNFTRLTNGRRITGNLGNFQFDISPPLRMAIERFLEAVETVR